MKFEHLFQELRRRWDSDRDEKLCVVCQDAPKAALLLPCRHLCVCRACSAHTALEKCPVCRAHIEDILDVFT